jgi:hypothetical protein
MGPEGGRPGMPIEAERHACSVNLGIVTILLYIRSDMSTASVTNSKLLYISPNPPNTVLHRYDHMIK